MQQVICLKLCLAYFTTKKVKNQYPKLFFFNF